MIGKLTSDKVKKYSIIIPTLNEAESIYDSLMALQALREQCEIIIADAGSTDNSKIISQPLVDLFITAPKGRATQMNAVTKAASANIFFSSCRYFFTRTGLTINPARC